MKEMTKAAVVFMAVALIAGLTVPAIADVRLPAILSDNMVLQQGKPVPVWGWAEPGEAVTVAIAGQERKAVAGNDGAWRVTFDALPRSDEPLTLVVKGKNVVEIKNVLVGEVWLCSGQSNMAFTVSSSLDSGKDKAAADLPRIRLFTVKQSSEDEPQGDCAGSWVVCTPSSVSRFSGVAFFFGREIHQRLDVPVGLINSSWGGTIIEAWTSREAQVKDETLRPIFEMLDAETRKPWDEAAALARYEQQMAEWEKAAEKAKTENAPIPRRPGRPTNIRRKNVPANLFNGMIHPLIPYALRGAIWYQGESNAYRTHANLYSLQLATLIGDWRGRWGDEFSFAWVQLPEFYPRVARPLRNWSVVREEMVKALRIPGTGMAIALGLGDPKDVHPKNKQDVGKRLALWALAQVYDQKLPSYSGPLYAGHEVKGSEVVISFRHADGGIVSKDEDIKGFQIAGEDQKWFAAKARIEGDKVIVSSPEVARPVAVRYAWAANPEWSLLNGAGLPASPFRTDDWDAASSMPSDAAK